jgi:hypothetical protein
MDIGLDAEPWPREVRGACREDLGVGIVGHCRKLLDGIAALSANANAKADLHPQPAALATATRPGAVGERRHSR